jgi:hypothetical protein
MRGGRWLQCFYIKYIYNVGGGANGTNGVMAIIFNIKNVTQASHFKLGFYQYLD